MRLSELAPVACLNKIYESSQSIMEKITLLLELRNRIYDDVDISIDDADYILD